MDIIQSHQLTFWQADNPFAPVQQFWLTPTIDDAPKICVAFGVQANALQLSFCIQQCDWLTPFRYKGNGMVRQDFLWENNCLECFFELQNNPNQNGYFEMNFSLNGAFNLYQFENYRTPNHLPPVWAKGNVLSTITDISNLYSEYDKIYHLTITLDGVNNLNIGKINPTAILYQNGEPIYYAIKHANPPDFHNKAYWTGFAL